jgi:hypothetical protein
MSKFTEKVKEEFLAVLPPTIFFFIALHIVSLIRSLMVKETGITLTASVSVLVAALILGKAVVIADLMPFINRYPDKPLAYNITWKTAIYTSIALLIHYLERLIEFWRSAGSFIAANEKLLAEIVWPHFWATQILLIVLIVMYTSMRELVRVIGGHKLREIFFGPLPR